MTNAPAGRRPGFVDIHSHILYGMDDGARTREESLRMLELAARDGTTDIVATPHANGRFRFNAEVVDAQIADLNAAVSAIRLHRGCDLSLQADTVENAVANPQQYTINGHQYLMVEFPDIPLMGTHDKILSHLLDARLMPIVTHPERNAAIRRRPERVARWVESGCYIQVTAGAILGRFGNAARESARHLLARGLVHVVASDGHDCRHRPPTLSAAYEVVRREWGEDVARALFVDNPRAVIGGQPVETLPAQPRPVRRWYQVWK